MRVENDPCLGECTGNPLDGTLGVGVNVSAGFVGSGGKLGFQVVVDTKGQIALVLESGGGADVAVGEVSLSLSFSATEAEFVQELTGLGVEVGGGFQGVGNLQINWTPSPGSDGSTIQGVSIDIGLGGRTVQALPFNFHVFLTNNAIWIMDVWELLGFERTEEYIWSGGEEEDIRE